MEIAVRWWCKWQSSILFSLDRATRRLLHRLKLFGDCDEDYSKKIKQAVSIVIENVLSCTLRVFKLLEFYFDLFQIIIITISC